MNTRAIVNGDLTVTVEPCSVRPELLGIFSHMEGFEEIGLYLDREEAKFIRDQIGEWLEV